MKLYTFYTDTHEIFLKDFFIPSLKKGEYDLVIEKFNQDCHNGKYMTKGWNNTMRKKVQYIIRSIEECWGNVFIHSDCDVQFFKPSKQYFISEIKNYDIVLQDDVVCYCAGFFVCRANGKTLRLFNSVLDNLSQYDNDQDALNNYINSFEIKHKKFDNRVYTIAMAMGGRWYGEEVEIPKDIIIHHANWTTGIDNKIKLLEYVRNKVVK